MQLTKYGNNVSFTSTLLSIPAVIYLIPSIAPVIIAITIATANKIL